MSDHPDTTKHQSASLTTADSNLPAITSKVPIRSSAPPLPASENTRPVPQRSRTIQFAPSSSLSESARRVSLAPAPNPERPGVQRRTSIQFVPSSNERPGVTRRTSVQIAQRGETLQEELEGPTKIIRRNISPPAPSKFEKRISFDTFDNKNATEFALTLKTQHEGYAYSKRSRTFLCGLDKNSYSEYALDWLLDELVDDGDEVVCFRVIEKDSDINSDLSIERGRYKTEANELMNFIKSKNKGSSPKERSISFILEFIVGKVHDTIQRMISVYEPSCLVVGTRGRPVNSIQSLMPGSVSKYCLQNSPVPVVVVKPSSKREKSRKKRQADPARQSYQEILERTGAPGAKGHILDRVTNDAVKEADGDEEAAAVRQAIGLPLDSIFAHRLSQSQVESSLSLGNPQPHTARRTDSSTSDGESPGSPGIERERLDGKFSTPPQPAKEVG